MSKLTLYIDGSEIRVGDQWKQGWGILALHHAGDTVELNGSLQVKRNGRNGGWHEVLAFYHAVNYAEAQGYAPGECSFYSDCDWVAYGGFHLVPENYSNKRLDVAERLQLFKEVFYPGDETLVERMCKWLVNAQMHWLKGHKVDVSNNRVDYLARSAIYNKATHECMDFQSWLENGFSVWDNEIKANKIHMMPFVKADYVQ